VERANAWAGKHGISLSDAVAGYFAQLPDRDTASAGSGWLEGLDGIAATPGHPAPTDDALREEYMSYLEAKYR
jgi:hypothetical protein